MAKNRGKQNNEERKAPNQGDLNEDASLEASSGKSGTPEKGRSAGTDRGADRTRTEPNLTEEPTRKGKAREATERESLDENELDEQNQEL